MQFSATSRKCQPQKRCWEKKLICVDALQVSCFRAKCVMTGQSRDYRDFRPCVQCSRHRLAEGKKTKTVTFFCSRVECSRPTFLNLISYVAECNKSHHLAEYRVGFCMLVVAHNRDSCTFVPGNIFFTKLLSIFES